MKTMIAEHAVDEAVRREIWQSHGARGSEIEELLEYARSAFDLTSPTIDGPFPLADEPSVAVWAQYAEEASADGAVACLRRHLPQLRAGVSFVDPDGIRVLIHATAAGRIPVIVTRARKDFVSLAQAVTARNEPVSLPSSVGAIIVGGFINWERVEVLRAQSADGALSPEQVAQTHLYHDRFILLSSGPYSAVPAEQLDLDADIWLEHSLRIRLEHECTHYFTRRVLGSMRNRIFDELLADYAGIVAAAGRYRADWFCHFMGLEAFPQYRDSGRLEHYRGAPPLSAGAFHALQRAVHRAAANLERAGTAEAGTRERSMPAVLIALARAGFEHISSVER
jgi:hypothetical protein